MFEFSDQYYKIIIQVQFFFLIFLVRKNFKITIN